MKRTIIIIFFFGLLYTLSQGCANHKADLVYPQPACDTTAVSLKSDLTPIMEANCFRCHSAENAHINGGDYNLEDTTTLKHAVLTGELISAIKQDGNLAPPMPADGGKLSPCEIDKFVAWGNQGAYCNN